MAPTARSFILDLLSTLRRGTMPVSALVEAAGLFDIAENSLRVALARLLARGQVARDERGCYRLGESAQPVMDRVTSWRDVEQRRQAWSGAWVAVSEAPATGGEARRARRQRERALRFLGLRALLPALHVRPDNLAGGVESVRGELAGLGLPPADLVYEIRALGPAAQAQACELWQADPLRAGYRKSCREIEESMRRLPGISAEAAMVESFLLGGRVIRQLVLDPLLPDEVVPGEERRTLVETMRRYDRVGRSAWAGFLERFDVPHLGTPADTRMVEGAGRLAL